ncbi:hypothetical protein [Thiocystis minor]|uniref:hypothetical protein n=1 Tax=Thiocystis minor TaxID=61597 RepID=UPI001912D06A|nr:hypothetical protein [Thiocystis minor]
MVKREIQRARRHEINARIRDAQASVADARWGASVKLARWIIIYGGVEDGEITRSLAKSRESKVELRLRHILACDDIEDSPCAGRTE